MGVHGREGGKGGKSLEGGEVVGEGMEGGECWLGEKWVGEREGGRGERER